MVSSQIIRGCLEQLRAITKIEFCVLDTAGGIVAQTEGVKVPDRNMVSGFAQSAVDSQIVGNSYFLKVMDEEELQFILTAQGNAEHTFMVARIAVSEIENLIIAYKEKFDRNNFFQNLLLDNLLLVDIHNRSKKLHIVNNVRRAIILFEMEADSEQIASEMLSGLFTVQNGDYLTEVDENSVILIKALDEKDGYKEVEEAAKTAVDMLNMEAMVKVRSSYGTIAEELKELSRSYKEARMAMDVGRIFYAGKRVISYNELGIGRLIYQLPPSLCKMFIQEIFASEEMTEFDQEILTTIGTFFDNNLNVSETARQLFVHRNTLVYRIEKLQKSTGLDIRTFDDAMTLKIALMVNAYMKELERRNGR
ncbi:MAG: helix-turn-helix domain-containing protein [Lachnospiraceae bacterium]|nr:helix-turn-helix domain-containing protein [Lachnospiraceae bacterium]